MAVVVLIWLTLLFVGICALWQYEHTAGMEHEPPAQWPAASQLVASAGGHTLLLFAHPKCPCTRASFGELERILTHCRHDVRVYAVFVEPKKRAAESDWQNSDLRNIAARIPGVTAVVDVDGVEATLFGAATSGFVVVYGDDGQLKFRGGITVSRGHSGDNTGRTAIVELLTTGSTSVKSTSVYGCELGTDYQKTDQQCCRR